MASAPAPRASLISLVPVGCCICGSAELRPAGAGEDFEYRTCPDTFHAMICPRCDLVLLNPRPAISDLDVIYPATYHAYDFTAESFGFVHTVRQRLEAKRLLLSCKGLPPGARILDVGCGDGFHLRLLKQYGQSGWHLEGVDASARAVAGATKSGLNVHLGRLEDVNLPRASYDLAFLIATIEHVEDPPGLLAQVHALLKPGGRVVIVTDNTGSPDFQLWKRRHWGGYHFPRHWNLFNARSLSLMASKTGFTVQKLETIVSPVNWVYSIRNWLVDRNAPPFLVEQFSLKATLSLAVFTLWDQLFQWFGNGALLRLTLQKKPAN